MGSTNNEPFAVLDTKLLGEVTAACDSSWSLGVTAVTTGVSGENMVTGWAPACSCVHREVMQKQTDKTDNVVQRMVKNSNAYFTIILKIIYFDLSGIIKISFFE